MAITNITDAIKTGRILVSDGVTPEELYNVLRNRLLRYHPRSYQGDQAGGSRFVIMAGNSRMLGLSI
jgi:hypothetical protein